MVRTRRVKTSPEKEAPAPSADDKAEEQVIWIRGASGLSMIVVLASLSFLLQIYAPSVSQLFVLGTAGAGAGLLAIWPLVSRLLKSVAISPVMAELMKRVSGAFGKPRVAFGWPCWRWPWLH